MLPTHLFSKPIGSFTNHTITVMEPRRQFSLGLHSSVNKGVITHVTRCIKTRIFRGILKCYFPSCSIVPPLLNKCQGIHVYLSYELHVHTSIIINLQTSRRYISLFRGWNNFVVCENNANLIYCLTILQALIRQAVHHALPDCMLNTFHISLMKVGDTSSYRG